MQQKVRSAIAQVGGYWRPLAGVVRLLEELGELGELLARPRSDVDELAGELADLWIITTAVADQFLGDVREPGALAARSSETERSLAELLASAGQIARIVNYYDGPKTPRSLDGPSLSEAVAEFHSRLASLARAHDLDLSLAVERKLAAMPERDAGRFARQPHDPSTAECLRAFHATATAPSTSGREPKLWGGPAWSAGSLERNVAAAAPSLTSFTRAAAREKLDAYVLEGPACRSIESLSRWREELFDELSRQDPSHDGHLQGALESAQKTFRFNGMSMAVTVLSALDERDPRQPFTAPTFIAFSPPDGEWAEL